MNTKQEMEGNCFNEITREVLKNLKPNMPIIHIEIIHNYLGGGRL